MLIKVIKVINSERKYLQHSKLEFLVDAFDKILN